MKKYFSRTKKEAAKKMIEVKKENQPFYDAVKQFEKNEIATVQSKAKLLTRLCVAEFVVIGLLGAGIAALAPLKTAVPYVIRVDNSTGYTDVVPQINNAKESYQEVETKYFLSQFVINYESYEWQTIQQMMDTVKVMSASKVFSQYNTAIRADSSPLNVLKDNYKMRVKIKSVTMLKPDVAQVRFSKMILDSSGKPAPEYRMTDWIATIAFDFNKKIETEEQRLINPLGFQALSYRVDPEAMK
ncbi:TPA: virB8 family protein [Escherichia coli]|uniref:virB8 family protein n=1 Tax=Enterobacteriaceae TaxID=543 RepID=UPI00114EC982|nr:MULTISPECIES: type IV secretion system protein [Enterobacteriaceae]ECL7789980.1 type IV secretion system protein [Salmonella enterica]EIC0237991.1 type IV secretion system protein [Salmonella enterica subsp. enterica serovar Infantis]HDR2785473.1 type IV secretion system protein [Enterobacter sichuanensis]EGZ3553184.1 type IV secretion system protein [Salmonella enterica]EHD7213994.1 type IV secretion system protein [Escherichia coli]